MGKIGNAIVAASMEELEKVLAGQEEKPSGKAAAGAHSADKKGHKDPPKKVDRGKVDKKGDGKSKNAKIQPKVKHAVGAKLTAKVQRVFQLLDASHDGFLETEEFVTGICKIPGVKKIMLSDGEAEDDTHLHSLAKRLDRGGKISIIEFLGAFCIEDN